MIDDIVRRFGYLTLGTRLRRISERLLADVQLATDAEGYPIQSGQWTLLAALEENGSMTIGEIASALGVTQPGVTRNVGLLEKQGLVSAVSGKRDQRQKIVSLTDAGRALVTDGRARMWPAVERAVAEMFDGRSGALLENLDALESALGQRPLNQRIADVLKRRDDDE